MISVELDRDGDEITTAADEIRKLLVDEELDKALLVATRIIDSDPMDSRSQYWLGVVRLGRSDRVSAKFS